MSAVRAALSVYDDATLEALANRGLLRRAAKDVEAGKVEIDEEFPDSIAVIADGERVEMDAGGPRTARCSCPATTVCRHRLAAVLLLRQDAEARAAGGSQPIEPHAVIDPLADVLALDAKALTKWAGRANVRAALDLIADAALEIERDGAVLRVRLGTGWPPVLILAGQGLDGIVSKVAPSRMRALHTAAVLAVWRDQGRDVEDLVDEASAGPVAELPDPTFLATVKSTLETAVSTAIAQAPELLEEQLFLFSISSRADDIPALSRRLRQLSGSVRARRSRDFTIAPAEMLSEMASAYALADALATCGDGMMAAPLRGAARQGYAPVGQLGLVGLAARQWETRGGARGITGYFYAHELKRAVTVSLARVGQHDRLFDPASAFHDEALWRAGPLRELIGARLDLQGARLSPEGRLSQAQETVGWKTAWLGETAEIRGWSITFDDWQTLQERMQDRFATRLTGRRREGPALVALLPAAQLSPWFDGVGQRTILPLQDVQGRTLALQIPHSTANAGTASRLKAVAAAARIEVAFVEVLPASDGFLPMPLSLAIRPTPDAALQLVLLDPRLASAQTTETDAAGGGTAEGSDSQADQEGSTAPLPVTPVGLLASEIQDALLTRCELGLAVLSADAAKLFAHYAARARNMGLGILAGACHATATADPASAARSVLRLAHLNDRVASMHRRLPLL